MSKPRMFLCGLLLFASVSTSTAAEQGYEKTLSLQGIDFHISCPNAGSLNTLTIAPAGLEIDNSAVEQEIEGTVSGAEVADLNGDGSPEIYVYVTSAGSGSYGQLVAYSTNRRKSMSTIYMAPLSEDKVHSQGYMGHDVFKVEGNELVRRFPIYKDRDSNGHPTGGTRELHYKLVPGEASWQLKLDKVVDK